MAAQLELKTAERTAAMSDGLKETPLVGRMAVPWDDWRGEHLVERKVGRKAVRWGGWWAGLTVALLDLRWVD